MGQEAGGGGALALVPSWVPSSPDAAPTADQGSRSQGTRGERTADRLLVVPDGTVARDETGSVADPAADLADGTTADTLIDLTDDTGSSRVLHSDPHDFAGLYVRHRWSFTLHARRYLRDQRDADEVVQEAFLRLFLALPELETELQAIAYCRRTITNLCIDRYRAQARRPRLVDLDSGGVGELADVEHGDPVVQAEDAALVRSALSMLSPLHRDALVKREVEEKPLPVIAEELEIPEESVKHLLFRARRALRKLLAGTSLAPGVDAEDGRSLVSAARAGSRGGLAAFVLLVLLGLGSGPNLEAVPVVGVDLPDVIGVSTLAETVGNAVSQVGGAVSGAVDRVTPGRDASPAAPARQAPAPSEPTRSGAAPGGGADRAGGTGTAPGTNGPGSTRPPTSSVPSGPGSPGAPVSGGRVVPAPPVPPATGPVPGTPARPALPGAPAAGGATTGSAPGGGARVPVPPAAPGAAAPGLGVPAAPPVTGGAPALPSVPSGGSVVPRGGEPAAGGGRPPAAEAPSAGGPGGGGPVGSGPTGGNSAGGAPSGGGPAGGGSVGGRPAQADKPSQAEQAQAERKREQAERKQEQAERKQEQAEREQAADKAAQAEKKLEQAERKQEQAAKKLEQAGQKAAKVAESVPLAPAATVPAPAVAPGG